MTELTERYVSATLRSIPETQRADIEAELRASIDDAIEARVTDGDREELAERAVLTELGDPDRLAAGYAGRPGWLIGPELFFDYKRVLTVLMVSVVPIVAAVIFVITLFSEEGIGAAFGSAFAVGLSVVLHVAFWTTLVFAIMERSRGGRAIMEWDLSHLPPLPTRGSVKLSETIGAIVGLTFGMAFLLLSRTVTPFTDAAGEPIPVFDPVLWSFWMPFLIGVLVLELVFELVKYRVGRWTWALASVNLALNALFAIPSVYLLMTDQLFNPAFFEAMGWNIDVSSGSPVAMLTAAVIVLVAVWDTVAGFGKARRD